MKKTLFTTLALAILALAIPAHASPMTVTISLVDPNQLGSVGETLQFFGVITNNTNQTVNLDGDDLTLNAPGITLIDDFNNNVPFFLTPDGTAGSSSGVIELFDVTLSAGFSGHNIGTYDLTGNTGGPGPDFILGATTFSVAPTPEPASIFLLLSSLPAAILPLRNRLRR
jgi:hypothetical protein